MSHAIYDLQAGTTVPIDLPREVWPLALPGKATKRGTRVARKLRSHPDKLRAFAPTEADAIAGRYIVPVVGPRPDPGPGGSLGSPSYVPSGDPVVAVATYPVIVGVVIEMKIAKGLEIDALSHAQADADFPHDHGDGQGVLYFSFSLRDKVNLMAMLLLKDVASYDRDWYDRDNLKKITIHNSNELVFFAVSAFGAGAAPYDAGNLILDQLNAATTPAEVQAVIDTRIPVVDDPTP